MNNQLIEKVIKSNDPNSCTQFTFENPLLDRNVAKALARSFVKIIKVSQQDSNVNNNLRHTVLISIRKLCRNEPENHLQVDESGINLLTETYQKGIVKSDLKAQNDEESDLDDFLVRQISDFNLNTKHSLINNPETMQSLFNLNPNCIENFSHQFLHMNTNNNKHMAVIKSLWQESCLDNNILKDVSIKLKSEIESWLLNFSYKVIKENATENILSCDDNIQMIMKKCSISPECFQMCSKILNHILVSTNFNESILELIKEFIEHVRKMSMSISVLYPNNMRHIVILLDIELGMLPEEYRNKYVIETCIKLGSLDSESDLIMLLSHFPVWFDIYFEKS